MAQGRGSSVPQHRGFTGHDGAFLELLGTPKMVFQGPSLPARHRACCDGTACDSTAAPLPEEMAPSGRFSPGSRLRVPGFDSRPGPVIMWLPGKEGSRRNWLLCLAPLQEVFLLGGTKVRAGWEAFPDSNPHRCAQPWQGGHKGAPPPPQHGAATVGATAQHTLHHCRGRGDLLVCVLGGKGLLCSRSGK